MDQRQDDDERKFKIRKTLPYLYLIAALLHTVVVGLCVTFLFVNVDGTFQLKPGQNDEDIAIFALALIAFATAIYFIIAEIAMTEKNFRWMKWVAFILMLVASSYVLATGIAVLIIVEKELRGVTNTKDNKKNLKLGLLIGIIAGGALYLALAIIVTYLTFR
jgi:hypothetical protein